jgi:hypothetical protein
MEGNTSFFDSHPIFLKGDRMPKLESDFQGKLIKELAAMFPGCMIQKLDSAYQQGIPDLLILWGRNWATLECKRSAKEAFQPNQEYYIAYMNEMSFSACIFPENKEEILNALQQSFRTGRPTRRPSSQRN